MALKTHYKGPESFFLNFGVKTGPDLPAGTYSKKILVTAITNRIPTTATLKAGKDFVLTINSLDNLGDIKEFKRSSTAPGTSVSTKVASIPTSEMPAYLWYDTPSKTVFWWSDADTVYANEDSSSMFNSLGDVEKIDMDGINTSRVKNMSGMFHSGKNLYREINLANLDTSNVEDMSYMFATHGMKTMENILPLDLSHFNTSKVKDMSYMFSNTFVPSLNIRSFDTSNVENMRAMFIDLENITDLDLSGWNVKKVNNILSLFVRDFKLKNLNLSGWELDSVTDMNSMFSGLPELISLNLTGFTTKNVTNMEFMFHGLIKLTDLDLSSFDTSRVTNMHGMFQNMQSLKNINLSSFDTSRVTTMNNMFRDNFALKDLNLSNFNTSNVTNMAEMFRHSGAIYPLDVSSFDTRKVTNMDGMFYWTLMAPENATLDISNFDTRSLTSALGMFNYTKAKTIYVSDQFTVNNLAPIPHEMFMSNTDLVGGNGTQYAYPNNNSGFAHIDAPGNPGYFTQKP